MFQAKIEKLFWKIIKNQGQHKDKIVVNHVYLEYSMKYKRGEGAAS